MPAVPATAQVFWLFGAWSEIVCNNAIYMYMCMHMHHSTSLLHASEHFREPLCKNTKQ